MVRIDAAEEKIFAETEHLHTMDIRNRKSRSRNSGLRRLRVNIYESMLFRACPRPYTYGLHRLEKVADLLCVVRSSGLSSRATNDRYFYCRRCRRPDRYQLVCHSLRKVPQNVLTSTFTAFLAIKSRG